MRVYMRLKNICVNFGVAGSFAMPLNENVKPTIRVRKLKRFNIIKTFFFYTRLYLYPENNRFFVRVRFEATEPMAKTIIPASLNAAIV